MKKIAEQFKINGEILEIKNYGNGHINTTFLVVTDKEKYILQKINTGIFRNYKELTENIINVTGFLKEKIIENGGNPDRETLTLIPCTDDNFYYKDGENVWRMYSFIEDTYCIDEVSGAEDFYNSAVAFGNFQNLLKDFKAEILHETIKDFHNTPKRYRDLLENIKSDKFDRVKEVSQEIEFITSREDRLSYLTDKIDSGILPLRVTHNDTKLNNILFDKDSGKAICIVDLDTVMPGLIAYDFGDSIRFGANHCAEDEHDLTKVNFDKSLYDMYFEGFITGCNNVLSSEEIKSLPYGAYLMTLENGIRFLSDYLDGDIYYKTEYPKQNLYRARTQLKLANQMELELNLYKNI